MTDALNVMGTQAGRLEDKNGSTTDASAEHDNREQDAPIITTPPKSKAAKFNLHTLKKLQAAVDKDPEVDLTTKFPTEYSDRLVEFQEQPPVEVKPKINPFGGDIRDFLQVSDPVEVVWPLSPRVYEILEETSQTALPLQDGLSQRIFDLLWKSEVIFKPQLSQYLMVFKCAPDVVVKAVECLDDDTEYTTLQYLETHKPDIPAPRPLGYVRMSGVTLIFQTYMPSTTLTKVWPELSKDQKSSIKAQLGTIMSNLRSIPYTEGSNLGGVAGEECRDIRRHLRKSKKPITSFSGYEEFMMSYGLPRGRVFLDLLRQLYPAQSTEQKIVFTHGDIRPDNVTVDLDDSGQWFITGLIDWEYSGFYPEYCESFKATNCLTPFEEDDWYLFLPDCISPKRYSHWWLLDRVREARVV